MQERCVIVASDYARICTANKVWTTLFCIAWPLADEARGFGLRKLRIYSYVFLSGIYQEITVNKIALFYIPYFLFSVLCESKTALIHMIF